MALGRSIPKSSSPKSAKVERWPNTAKAQTVFAQGDVADSVFYIQEGKLKVTVVSELGKEAVVAILGKDEFFGQGCLAGQPKRIGNATTLTECEIMRIEKDAITRILREEPAFSQMFLTHLLDAHDPCGRGFG